MNGVDVLRFAPGIRPEQLQLQRRTITGLSGTDTLEITFRDSNDSLTLRDYFISNHAIEQIVFADGTVWDESAVKAMLLAGTEAAQSLQAFREGSEIHAGGGNDVLTGDNGNDALYGEAGDDTLAGLSGDDLLSGGRGNDRLEGEAVMTPTCSPPETGRTSSTI
jgi:Ca2+-binding RTX toxin-like protein